MSKHTRFYIDLDPTDSSILNKLVSHLTAKQGVAIIRADVMRLALRAMAKKEKV